MGSPREPSDPAVDDDGLSHLLAATRLMFTAAGAAEQISARSSIDADLHFRLLEADLKTLLWQAVALLPAGLRLDGVSTGQGHLPDQDHRSIRDDLRAALDAADHELRQIPTSSQGIPRTTLLDELADLRARLATLPPLDSVPSRSA